MTDPQEGRDSKGHFIEGNALSVGNQGGKPPFYTNPEEMEVAINKYFEDCDSKKPKEPYTVPGLAYALGFLDRQSILNYKGKPEFHGTIKRAKLKMESQRNLGLLTPGKPTVGFLFDMKNNFGWVDKQELDVKDTTTLSDDELDARLRARGIDPETLKCP